MLLSDILKNPNFTAEFPYSVRVYGEYCDPVTVFNSWENPVPPEYMDREVVYMNVYSEVGNMPCLVIEIEE